MNCDIEKESEILCEINSFKLVVDVVRNEFIFRNTRSGDEFDVMSDRIRLGSVYD